MENFFLWKIRRSVPQTHDYYYYKIMIRLDWIGYFSGFSSSNNDDIKKKNNDSEMTTIHH